MTKGIERKRTGLKKKKSKLSNNKGARGKNVIILVTPFISVWLAKAGHKLVLPPLLYPLVQTEADKMCHQCDSVSI